MPHREDDDVAAGEGASSVRLELSNSLAAPKAARHVIEGLLVDQTHTFMDDALLMTSELVTNAVMHAGTKCTMCAQFDSASGWLRVEVADRSHHVPALPMQPDADAIGGHGLRIVAAIARQWGVASTRTGKVMWFELGGGSATVS